MIAAVVIISLTGGQDTGQMAAVDPPLFRWRNEEGTKKNTKANKADEKKKNQGKDGKKT